MQRNTPPLLQKSYHIPLPLFEKAFRAFQKKYVYPRNIGITIVLAMVAIVYIDAAVQDSTNTMAYLLLVLCVALIFITWYNPLKLRRALLRSLAELENDTYHLTVYAEGLVIGTEDAAASDAERLPAEPVADASAPEPDADGFVPLFEGEAATASVEPIPETELPFGAGLKLLEYETFFMVYLVKHNFYVIPKEDMTQAELQILRKAFQISD